MAVQSGFPYSASFPLAAVQCCVYVYLFISILPDFVRKWVRYSIVGEHYNDGARSRSCS